MNLTNREIASIIIIIALFLFALVLSKRKDNAVAQSFIEIVRCFIKLANVFIPYFLYVILILFIAAKFGFWQVALLKDTIIIVFASLLYLISNANSTKSERTFWKDVVLSTVGALAFFTFYINSASFSVVVEILIQILLLVFIFLYTYTENKKKDKSVFILSTFVLAIIVIIMFCHATRSIIINPNILKEGVPALVLSIWLPLLIAPFNYIILVISRYESLWKRQRFVYQNPWKLRAKIVIFLMFGISLFYVSNFSKKYHWEMREKTKLKEIFTALWRYKAEINNRKKEEDLRIKNLKRNAGSTGVDEQGHRFDRREFYETKKMLDSLYFIEMGQSRTDYAEDLLELVTRPSTLKDSREHYGIEFMLSSDKKDYCAWRKTVSEWYFGIGGTDELDEKWLFSGDSCPISYPGGDDTRWVEVEINNQEMPIEWAFDDSPKL